MANKDGLRKLRDKTVINETSKKQEMVLIDAVKLVAVSIQKKFGLVLQWDDKWFLKDIVSHLRKNYPSVEFCDPLDTTYMKPDGGILSLLHKDGGRHPILIAERKNQGTNDLRKLEGKKRQAQGNAVERLGKNVIGLKTAMTGVGIFPFVCFGDGCDFEEKSSILDRVITVAMFGHLRKIYLGPDGPNGEFLRGSYYFRSEAWKSSEIVTVLEDIATRSVHFYISKYGDDELQRK
jgi:type II restriction enzyme